MAATLSWLAGLALKLGALLIVANEIRGLMLAAPILYGMYQAGGTWMALWLGFCSLAGIALSVIVPLFAVKKVRKFQLSGPLAGHARQTA